MSFYGALPHSDSKLEHTEFCWHFISYVQKILLTMKELERKVK